MLSVQPLIIKLREKYAMHNIGITIILSVCFNHNNITDTDN